MATGAGTGELVTAEGELDAGEDEPQAAKTMTSASFTLPTIVHRLP